MFLVDVTIIDYDKTMRVFSSQCEANLLKVGVKKNQIRCIFIKVLEWENNTTPVKR